MRILFSIILNALILYIITYLLSANPNMWIDAWVILGCWDCSYNSIDAAKIYLLWGIILWLINITIRPILNIISIPLFFLTFWLVSFAINAIILWLLNYIINNILVIPWFTYQINWWLNFTIAVAIFTILNMIYSLLLFKKW
jgi:putative membrane protein